MAASGRHTLTISFWMLLVFVMGITLQVIRADPITEDVYPASSKRSTSANGPTNIEDTYDEYPMVVPKRAALLLDRLMVALHRALEEERKEGGRVGEFHGHEKTPSFILNGGSLADFDPTEHEGMYGDEVQPDYDIRNLRDLKTLNRGSGETLMAKSFQRRTPPEQDSVSGRSNGRMYWRCYFNAVSCF